MASLSQLTAQVNEAKENRVGVIELLVQLESYMPDVVDGMIQDYMDKIAYLSQNGQKILESSNPSHAKLKKDLEFELAFGRGLDNLFNGRLNQGSLSWQGFQQEVRMLNGSYNNGTILQDKNVQGGARPSIPGGQTAAPPNRSSVQTPAPYGGGSAKPQSDDDEMAEILRAIAEAEAAEQKLKDQVRIDADAMGARRDMRGLANRDRDAEQARRDLAAAAGIESRLRQEYEQADGRRRRDEDIQAERDIDGLRDRFGRAGQEEARLRDLAMRDARAERDADVLRDRVSRDAQAERAAQDMRVCDNGVCLTGEVIVGLRGIAAIGSKFQQEQDRIERDRQDRERRRREEEEAEKSLQALRAKMDSEAKAQRDRERRAREDAEAEKEAHRLRQLLANDSKRNREAELEADKMRDFARKDPKQQRQMEKNTRNERESEGLRNIMREIAGAQKRGANIASKENLGYQYSDEDEPTSKRYNANAAASVIGGSMGTLLNQGAFADLLSKGLGGGLLSKDNQDAYTLSEKHKLEEELRNATSQLDSMKSLVNEEEQKYLTLKDKLHSMRTLGNEVETDIENIRQEREEEEQATKDLEKEIADLEKDLKQLDQEHQEVLRNDEQRLDVHQEIRKERNKHKELLQKLEVEIQEYKSSYESLMKKWQEDINGGPAVASTPVIGNYLGNPSRTRFIGQGEPYSISTTKTDDPFSVSDRLAAIRSRISEPVQAYQPSSTSSLSRLAPVGSLDYRSTQYTSSRPDAFTHAAATSGVTIRSASRDVPTLRASIQPNFYQTPTHTEYRSGSVGPQQQSFQSGSYADRYLSTLRK